TLVVAQPLGYGGHRHRHRQLIIDTLVMHRDLRPGQRPSCRVDQLRKPAPNSGPPQIK
ncbi:MAG: hypothetical protein QOD72_1894, partial [Acidimicrobiaceae bacterium]|nr:hypothetical protein [Acidimicrobiaceae bacterium]